MSYELFFEQITQHYDKLSNIEFSSIIIDQLPSIPSINIDETINELNSTKWDLITGDQCERLFGNGFDKKIISCHNVSNFSCFANTFSYQLYCHAENLIIDPTKIDLSFGGEEILSVKNRKEDYEFPVYSKHAFNIDCSLEGDIPRKDPISFYLYDVLTEAVNNNDQYQDLYNKYCDRNDSMIYLVTMRYEYANLYHQITEWYNFYQLIHSLGLQNRNNLKVIFLDGHAKSSLDIVWKTLFGDYIFIKHFGENMVCLKNVIFIPPGYVGGISLQSTNVQKCGKPQKYVQLFGNWVLNKFGIKPLMNKEILITLICRKQYVAHPRNLRGNVERKWVKEDKVEESIKQIVASYRTDGYHIVIKKVSFEDMGFKEQLELIHQTNILIGAHGAGLSHLLFLPKKTSSIIECTFEENNIHFMYFALWSDHHFQRVQCIPTWTNDVSPNKRFGAALQHSLDYVIQNLNEN